MNAVNLFKFTFDNSLKKKNYFPNPINFYVPIILSEKDRDYVWR